MRDVSDDTNDPVYWAKHFWEEQKLDGDEQRFLTLSSLLRYHRLVADAVDDELKKCELNLTDYLTLMTLQLSKTGTRLISDLARGLLIHATTATLVTDRLERRAMLRRSPHPTDRRATCITITDLGREAADGATRALHEINFGLSGTNRDVKRFYQALTTMRRAAGDAGPH
ncbi:MarR family winged helix-turn-helix transcriptional regulator [Mycobacterium sp. NPDC003449]